MPLDNSNIVNAPTLSIIQPYAQNLVVSCGHGGNVTISLEDGKVTLTDCSLDDGAKAWWAAVEQFAPMKK
jgi:hypothetical protein